jgi:hypothetical protein
MTSHKLTLGSLAALAVAFALAASLPATALAQQDDEAGLFVKARHLPLVSQAVDVEVTGAEAVVHVTQVFHNDGADVGQADYHLVLPDEASVVAFGFWQGDKFLEATLQEKSVAEAAHKRAAHEGRATAILKRERNIHSFSVYPLVAGELKQVEVTMRAPVVAEMGRNHLVIPVDTFLGQPAATSTVRARIASEEPLTGFGVEGVAPHVVGRSPRAVELAFTTSSSADVWWHEELPPLLVRAEAVRLPDASWAEQLRVILNHAGDWRPPYKSGHVIVDGSFSMRRRGEALGALLRRLAGQSPVDVGFTVVAGRTRSFARGEVEGALGAVAHADARESVTWGDLAAAARRAGCGQPEVLCVAVTDPQLPGLPDGDVRALPALVLADAHERSYFDRVLPADARVFQLDADPPAKLDQLADELVLPVFELARVRQGGRDVALVGHQATRVPEGSVLRLAFSTPSLDALEIEGTLAGRPFRDKVVPRALAADDAQGPAVRLGFYRQTLATWMEAYDRAPDRTLRERIVAVSVREGIPTALTALQVDDPDLSMRAIKPGDPVLRVKAEPGLEEVVAVYPFGETRRLVLNTERGVWSDRFLVPRGWQDGAYDIELVERYASGRVRRQRAFYRLDERAPGVAISFDAEAQLLRVTALGNPDDITRVAVHVSASETLVLGAQDGVWSAAGARLPARFAVVVRNRAGNRSELACRLEKGALTVTRASSGAAVARRARRTGTHAALVTREPPLDLDGHGLARRGSTVFAEIGGRTLRFPAGDAQLGSLELRATLSLDGDTHLFGTAAGDLVRLRCTGDDCRAQALAPARGSFAGHPVTDLAPLDGGRVLVTVLGMPPHVLAGDHLVASARRPAAPRSARPAGVPAPSVSLPSFVASALFRGRVVLGAFDGGLAVLDGADVRAWDLGLRVDERRVNALAVADGALWVGTMGGLLRVHGDADPGALGFTVERVLPGEVHGLAAGEAGLAVASARGLYVVAPGGAVERRDAQAAGSPGRFTAVAWWRGRLYAGSLDGLHWFGRDAHDAGQVTAMAGFRAGWITALAADADQLWVGTYAEGVWQLDGAGRAWTVAGLEGQWVPPGGLARIGAEMWVGGVGMPPARLGPDGAFRVLVPARDVNGFAADGDTLLLLTGAGLARTPRATPGS